MQLQSFLEESARHRAEKTALLCGGRSLTFEALERDANRLAHGLIAQGVRRGDRVAIYLDNGIEAVVSLFAVLKADAVVVIVNSATKQEKLVTILSDCRASTLIAPGRAWSRMETLRERNEHLKTIVVTADEDATGDGVVAYDRLLALNGDRTDPPPTVGIDVDLAALIYTSGSTGKPKGVMLSHRNMIAAADSVVKYLELAPEDITLSVLPLAFSYGLYQVLMSVRMGATVVLERSFAFPHAVMQQLVDRRATCFPIVPTMAAMMLRLDLSPYDFSSLRLITSAGAALPIEHIRQLRKRLPSVDLYVMYGQTECKRALYLPPDQVDLRPDSVGKAIPNTETYLVDETGRPVGPGEVGELVVRGAHVMQGYWELPEATARSLRPCPMPGRRVLHTGDLFRMDDEGYLYFVGRRDDIIKCRGEKVSPLEVENVLCEHPAVAEAAVIGLPDELLGEAVHAVVALGNNQNVTKKELIRHCAIRLENTMVPGSVDFVDQLPKTDRGKIDKKQIKENPFGVLS